jgi:hypothetical protein
LYCQLPGRERALQDRETRCHRVKHMGRLPNQDTWLALTSPREKTPLSKKVVTSTSRHGHFPT